MLGSPILYLKGMRILMFQLSGFYCRGLGELASGLFRSNGLVRCQHTWVMGTLILSLSLSLSLCRAIIKSLTMQRTLIGGYHYNPTL